MYLDTPLSWRTSWPRFVIFWMEVPHLELTEAFLAFHQYTPAFQTSPQVSCWVDVVIDVCLFAACTCMPNCSLSFDNAYLVHPSLPRNLNGEPSALKIADRVIDQPGAKLNISSWSATITLNCFRSSLLISTRNALANSRPVQRLINSTLDNDLQFVFLYRALEA